MTNELTVVEENKKVALFDQQPAAMVANATEIANVLSNVIKRQNLSVNIQGNEYVKGEGWNCLGSLLGILPREREVKMLEDGSFEAYVELISHKTGAIVGCGSALCSVTEPRWSKAPLYARRSMAITRATGKAYRLGLSWIVTLAGYAPTPFEEMDGIDLSNDYAKPPKKEFKKAEERFPEPKITDGKFEDCAQNKKFVMAYFAKCELPLNKENMINAYNMIINKDMETVESTLVHFCKELKSRGDS